MTEQRRSTIQIIPFPSGEAKEVAYEPGWTVERAALEVQITDLKGMRLEINGKVVDKNTILKPNDMVSIVGQIAQAG